MTPAQPETVVLWRPTGRAELDLVAASGWRAWPPRLPDQPIFYPVINRWYATKIAREWNVPAESVGFVTRFEVDATFMQRYPVQQVGGRDVLEYWIPAEHLPEFNAHIVGAIVEDSAYRGPVDDDEFDWASRMLGHRLPAEWQRYLQAPSWFWRGWMADGSFVRLYSPREAWETQHAWGTAPEGMAIIGDDGSRELLALDLREAPAPVMLVDIAGAEPARQAGDVGDLVERIEARTFTFSFT